MPNSEYGKFLNMAEVSICERNTALYDRVLNMKELHRVLNMP